MPESRTRTLTIDRTHAKAGDTFPVTLSTETPYLREFGYEILDHSRVDLSRAPLPLIESHNASQLNIGIVDGLYVEDGKLRGTMRMGKSARAKEIKADIHEGIVRNVSIGYQVSDGERIGEKDGEPVYRFAFFPHELSLVAAGADINAGIYRSNIMETQENTTRSERKNQSNQIELERHRASEILVIGKQFGYLDLAQKGVDDGESVADFREKIVRKLELDKDKHVLREYNPIRSENFAGMPCDNTPYGRSLQEVKFTDAILAQANPTKYQGGVIREISKDLERSMGRQTEGLFLPLEALQMTRAVSYGGTGSSLVETEFLASQFIDLLRNHTKVIQAGAMQLPGLTGNVAIPLQDGAGTGYWFAGDDGDSITETTPTFSQNTMEPHFLGYLSRYSLRTLTQATPGIEFLVRNDQARGAGVEMDRAALNGSGAGAEPRGVLNTSGIGSATYANGGSPDFADVVGLETTLNAANADSTARAYICTPSLAGGLKTTDKGTDTGAYVFESGNESGSGRMNGTNALVSGNMPAGHIVLGNWADLLIGTWGGLEVLVNPYDSTDFAKGTVAVRSILTADFLVRQPAAFAEIHEAAP